MEGLNLNYADEGGGDVIVFLHGLSDSLFYWEVLANTLKKDFRVIRVDLRGHGNTPLGNEEITIDKYCEDLKNLLDYLDISEINLVGFSLGGAVALDFSVKYPHMLSSLVLMSTFSKCDNYLENVFSKFKANLSEGFEKFYDYMIPKVLCPDVIENHKKELEMIKQDASQLANVDAYIKACDACFNFSVDDELSKIDVFTLILAGRYDGVIPLRYQKNLKDKIRNSRLIVFDNVKHNLLVGKNNVEIINILKKELK